MWRGPCLEHVSTTRARIASGVPKQQAPIHIARTPRCSGQAARPSAIIHCPIQRDEIDPGVSHALQQHPALPRRYKRIRGVSGWGGLHLIHHPFLVGAAKNVVIEGLCD